MTPGHEVRTKQVLVRSGRRQFLAQLACPVGEAAQALGPPPVVAFGHGFLQTANRYRSTLTALAARGFVVIAPDSATGLLPRHGAFADDLWGAIAWARAEVDGAHPTLAGVAGHSMGGGAALLAAARHTGIASVATLAAARTRPSALPAVGGLGVPSLFVVGTHDRIVRPEVTRELHDAVPARAEWVAIEGGYHCGFCDSTAFGGMGCDSGEVTREEQLARTATLLGDWFERTLSARSS
jgi:pimeloyl-ACP methyl ester carboxylesterase